MSKLRIPSEANTAAWFFLAPALALIGVFFFLPVAASLLLSVTDFDLYGIANPGNTRFVSVMIARARSGLCGPGSNSTMWSAISTASAL